MNTPNTINGRTPEEIKRGLECYNCKTSPYKKDNCGNVDRDALAYIQQLKPKNNPFADARYPIDRDAEIKKIDMWGAEFDQYLSPLALEIAHDIDEATMNAIVNVGVTVDKEELLKALQYDRDQFAAGFKAGRKAAQPKWISVEERLPEDGAFAIFYYVKNEKNMMAVGYYFDYGMFIVDGHSVNVTHWMPLPEPPKEDE